MGLGHERTFRSQLTYSLKKKVWAQRLEKLKVFEQLSIPGPKPNIFCQNFSEIYIKVRKLLIFFSMNFRIDRI
jgi:hypothetical protein